MHDETSSQIVGDQKITLTPGGQGTSTLNVRATHKTPIGGYTITITGTSGSLSHSVTLTVNVT